VGPRAGLDSVVKRKIPSPCREGLEPPIIQPVAQRCTPELSREVTEEEGGEFYALPAHSSSVTCQTPRGDSVRTQARNGTVPSGDMCLV
jgi:hypothetical protein